MQIKRFASIVAIAVFMITATVEHPNANGQTRDEQVRQDRENLADSESWYYDDFEKATEVALAEKKPMMVVLRCIP